MERTASAPRTVTTRSPYSASAFGETGWVLLRIQRAEESNGSLFLAGLTLLDGEHRLAEIDLESGAKRTLTVEIRDFQLQTPYTPASGDVAVWIERAPAGPTDQTS
jgi:hypothetical protein